MPKLLQFEDVVGSHPKAPNPIGERFSCADSHSTYGLPTRVLAETDSDIDQFVEAMRDCIRNHHSRPEDLERDRQRRDAYTRQGLTFPVSRFPVTSTTRKGNWAEVLLCEYVMATCNASLPVYRLRYNPNVEQSMKGDDVLAFDLNSDPVRVIVGEAKFRKTPSKKAVIDIVDSLE